MLEHKLENVKCPACQSDKSNLVAKPISHHSKIEGEFHIVKCLECELLYLNPRPTPEYLEKFYQIISNQSNPQEKNPLIDEQSHENLLKRLWRKLNYSNPLIPLIDTEPVLDIGCGRGELLLELSKRGYQVSGLEFNPEAVQDCRRKGLQVIQGNIETHKLQSDQYKCFVLSHALEHFLDPVAVLSKLKQALPDDGKIVIAVPYAKSPMVTLFKNDWHGWDPPFHLTHFNKATIKKICEKAGLAVDKIDIKGHPEDFTRSLILKTKRPRRYLILRALLLPIFWGIQLLGSGSYLLVSAVPKGER